MYAYTHIHASKFGTNIPRKLLERLMRIWKYNNKIGLRQIGCEGFDFNELAIFCEDNNKRSDTLQQENLDQLSSCQQNF
jgi:hypothetical protein